MRLLDNLSELFVRIISFDYFIVKKIIAKHLQVKKGESILDLGCGTGILAPLFPKKYYIGIDIDPSLIETARKRNKDYNFLVDDVTTVNLNKKFNYILVCGVIHHMKDIDTINFINKIKSHIDNNGKILIIEAIPPIFNWNLLGHLNRKMDKGAYIRKLQDYKKFFIKDFMILESYNQLGGFADYAVFLLKLK